MAEEPDLDHLCDLARLRLDEEQKDDFQSKFAEMCDFVEAVNQADLPEESELDYFAPAQPLRGDEPESFEYPGAGELSFRVPEVLEGEGGDEQ